MHPRRLTKPTTSRRTRPALALAVLAAGLTLAACGSSASSSTSTSTTSTSTSASATTSQASGSSRFTALRSCLSKQGIALPAPSGERPPGGSGATGQAGPRGGGFKLPEGVSQTQFQEALKKCGAGNFKGGARSNSATPKAALTQYLACMRESGVNLPTPNTSGTGPVFNTKGINTRSAAFKTAAAKCQSDLPAGVGGSSAGTG
jgi:hypothetical protein